MERKGLSNGHRAGWETPQSGFLNRESEVRILPGALLAFLQIAGKARGSGLATGPLYIPSTSPGYSPIAASVARPSSVPPSPYGPEKDHSFGGCARSLLCATLLL